MNDKMMIDQAAFIERLDRAKSLGLKAKAAIAEGIRTNRFEGQEVFLSPGNFANAIYFIQHGLIRGAIEGREGKLSTWFKQEGDLILPQGIFNQKPSEEYISAINRTVVSVLPLKHLRKVAESFPEVYELIIAMLSEYLKDGQYREKLLRIPAAKDRYQYLSLNEAFVLKRVPHYMIASYLNVTKETFSRLHKGLPY